MWLLKDSNGKIKYVCPNKVVTFGRKQADIILANDSSISRAHAAISVILKEGPMISEASSTCILKDMNSKYGTFIIRNGVQIKSSSDGLEVQHLDKIKFGLQQHTYTVEYLHFVTVTSRLSVEHKKKLKHIMDSIGGIIIDFFDDKCTHLTATTATSTNKIISALIVGLPIVDIEYWIAVVSAVEANEKLPNPNSFLLTLQDKGLNHQRVSLKPNPSRKTLFKEKTFIFFSEKTYTTYEKMIKYAGGKVEIYTPTIDNIPNKVFQINHIVMQMTHNSITEDLAVFNTVLNDELHEKGLRMIAETEIPLAIIYICLDQYCNPKYHFKQLIRRKSPQKDTSDVLVLDTQEISEAIAFSSVSNPDNKAKIVELNQKNQKNILQLKFNKLEDIRDDLIGIENGKGVGESTCIGRENIQTLRKLNEEGVESQKTIQNSSLCHKLCDEQIQKDDALFPRTTEEIEARITEYDEFLISRNENSNFAISIHENSDIDSGSISNEFISNEMKEQDRKKTDLENMSDNIAQSLFSNKKRKYPVTEFSDQSDSFSELEIQKNKMREKQETKLNRWGFKRTGKKAIDFDLDDINANELKPYCITDKSDKFHMRQYIDKIESSSKSIKIKLSEDSKPNKLFKIRSLEINNEEHKPLFDESDIKLVNNVDIKNNTKTFKKVYSQIPVARIAFSNMSVWNSKK